MAYSAVHQNENLAELVCSNSLGSISKPNASFLLKEEMRILGSLIMKCAEQSKVDAGRALAVDRSTFSKLVTKEIESCSNVRVIRQEAKNIPKEGIIVVASGPMTGESLGNSIRELTGQDHLYFYDAVSPIIETSTIDMNFAFEGARYEPGSKDYLNVPFSRQEYYSLVEDLRNAEVVKIKSRDESRFFESCMPIEEMAIRGEKALSFGPMKPVGFGRKVGDDFYAVLQLRKENTSGTMHNMVGFQTRMTYPEQKRVFSRIKAFRNANFLRLGKMHRNTYINSRKLLKNDLSLHNNNNIYFTGQLSGVDGYCESAASGLAVSLYIAQRLNKGQIDTLPGNTMIGALLDSITSSSYDRENFQPMNANFGILSEAFGELKMRKKEKKTYIFEKALENARFWFKNNF